MGCLLSSFIGSLTPLLDYHSLLIIIPKNLNALKGYSILGALVNGIVNKKRLNQRASDVTYSILRYLINQKLYLLKMLKSVLPNLRYCLE